MLCEAVSGTRDATTGIRSAYESGHSTQIMGHPVWCPPRDVRNRTCDVSCCSSQVLSRVAPTPSPAKTRAIRPLVGGYTKHGFRASAR